MIQMIKLPALKEKEFVGRRKEFCIFKRHQSVNM